jgi:MFS family permease
MQAGPQPSSSPLPDSAALAAHRTRGLFFLGMAVACVGFALAMQMGLNSNFTAQELRLDPEKQGILEAVRETCGIIALGVLAILAAFAEPLIAFAMLVLLGIGLGSYCFVHDYTWLLVASLVWSQGLHVWMPLPHSMTLALAEPGQAGRRLGQVQAAGAVGSGVALVLALALVWLGRHGVQPFGWLQLGELRPLYLVAGAVCILGGLACLGIPYQMKAARPRLVFRKRYWLYYLLTFLEGWRKQICLAFAGYLLVREYHVPLDRMLLIWLGIQTLSWFVAPLAGRWIDRAGERRVLGVYYTSMAVVFSGYAFVESIYVLGALYVLDNVFFAFTMAQTTYVNRIAPPSEHTATLSMGVAMNHIASVLMPLIGGLLWKYLGHQWTFLAGAFAAAAGAGASLWLPAHGTLPEKAAESGPTAEQLAHTPQIAGEPIE